MDLQELSERTGITRRKLRYVLDHDLVPGLKIEIAESEAGRPRKFHGDVGVGIVCAAHLLVMGMRHEQIRWFLEGFTTLSIGGKPALNCLLERHRDLAGQGEVVESKAYLGDGVNIRLTLENIDYDSKWQAPQNPAPLAAPYEPKSLAILNLGRILDEVMLPAVK